MILGYTGLPRAGKGISLMREMYKVAKRNRSWQKRYGFFRPIYANFMVRTNLLGYPVVYFSDPSDLYSLSGADIFIDEAYKYWNARSWERLPDEAISWFAEQDKLGCDIYFATQEFAMLDVMFRRVTEEIYWVSRVFGSRRPGKNKPPVKKAWGLIAIRKIKKFTYNENSKELEDTVFGIPRFVWISDKLAKTYDTTERIKVIHKS